MENEAKGAAVLGAEEQEAIYNEEYLPKVHRFGTLTMLIILVLSFLPAVYLSFVMGFHPGWGVIGQAVITMVGIEFFSWLLEPALYFSMIGVTGSYISFVSGNITNMRIPAAVAAQNAVGAKLGTRKNEFAGAVGIVSSVIVNFAVLIAVILFGNFILSVMPQAVVDALVYALPSVYGALLVTFIARLKM